MITDNQALRLFALIKEENTVNISAMKTGMNVKTARKYLRNGKMPSQVKSDHHWKTREDPFEQTWPELKELLDVNPGLEAKTLFEHLQRTYPGRFQDGQLRTLQRKIKRWRATDGPHKEIFFPQEHYPGELGQSDFTDMTSLNITIQRRRFSHLLYHFVLTWSNWESAMVCFSESFESLSEGIQHALWQLGGTPNVHRTDRLSAAVHKDMNPNEFTRRYQGLLDHYGMQGQKTQSGSPHENGDIEQRNNRIKRAVDQSLMLRGSRDFDSREEYQFWLAKLIEQLNSGRHARFKEELSKLKALPKCRMDSFKRSRVRVGPSSTIRVAHNTYSVDSRLKGEHVDVRLYGEKLEIWYGQKKVDTLPRLRGEDGHHIEYRHIIDSLVRKPGAFANYRYRRDLFPTHRFRMAYDQFKARLNGRGDKTYLQLLHLAARENEAAVDQAIGHLFEMGMPIELDAVKELLQDQLSLTAPRDIAITAVDLTHYDQLLSQVEVE